MLQMIITLPVRLLQPRGLLSCRGAGKGVSERAGSWYVNTAVPNHQMEQNVVSNVCY